MEFFMKLPPEVKQIIPDSVMEAVKKTSSNIDEVIKSRNIFDWLSTNPEMKDQLFSMADTDPPTSSSLEELTTKMTEVLTGSSVPTPTTDFVAEEISDKMTELELMELHIQNLFSARLVSFGFLGSSFTAGRLEIASGPLDPAELYSVQLGAVLFGFFAAGVFLFCCCHFRILQSSTSGFCIGQLWCIAVRFLPVVRVFWFALACSSWLAVLLILFGCLVVLFQFGFLLLGFQFAAWFVFFTIHGVLGFLSVSGPCWASFKEFTLGLLWTSLLDLS
ncbi:Hypothetical predicted protein [Olea europaea subsp. europaea]|uniref:Uncharacterized protein n=1 Tax=Olea europaea subsp. europaea TaxID=158383 RepID=A0A8S0QSY1_OLEEU|nr:Hypothetical predicted protein [Olea europaea subsp. europaea]